jgi:hypothetical protein
MRGSSARGTSNAASSSSSLSSVSKPASCVRLAFVTSVTCTPPAGPPVRFHKSHVSMVPNSKSPVLAFARAPGTLSSSHFSFKPLKEVASGRPVRARNRSWPSRA